MLRIISIWLKKAWLYLGAIIGVYILMAVILSFISTRSINADCIDKKIIYLSTNGLHLDIVVSRHLLGENLSRDLDLPTGFEFVAFGWGDKEFYLQTPTWADLRIGPVLRAFFTNSDAAIHLTKYRERSDQWMELQLCEGQWKRLNNYLENSFKRNANGNIINIEDSGYHLNDTFYEAHGKFHAINTCNQWVNEGLKTAGIKTAIWSPFDFGVLWQVRKST